MKPPRRRNYEYPDNTRGSEAARRIRPKANKLTSAERAELHRRAMQLIYGGIDNRLPALHSLGVGGREYKAVFVVGDIDLSRRSPTKAEVSQFSDEITVNCAPLV